MFGKNGEKRPPDDSQLHRKPPPHMTPTNTLTFEHYADETTDRETARWAEEYEDASEFELRTQLPVRRDPAAATAEYLLRIERETEIKPEAVLEYLIRKKEYFEDTDSVISALERDRKLSQRSRNQRSSKTDDAVDRIKATVEMYREGEITEKLYSRKEDPTPEELLHERIRAILEDVEPSLTTYYKIRKKLSTEADYDLKNCPEAEKFRRELQK